MQRKMKTAISYTIITIILTALALVILIPVVWIGICAFRPQTELMQYPPKFFAEQLTLQNFIDIAKRIKIWGYVKNSLLYCLGSTIPGVFLNSLAGYAFARLDFKGKHVLFIMVLATMMIPFQVIMVPLYLEVYYLKWLNTYWGLIIPKVASAYWIFLCRAAFQELPKELEDAARIDGLGEFGIFWKIMLPLVKPTMITMLLLGINNCWNDLLWPLIVANASTMRTLSNGLAIFIGDRTSEYSLAFTAATVSMLPMLILYIFGQKYFVAGQVSSGIKG